MLVNKISTVMDKAACEARFMELLGMENQWQKLDFFKDVPNLKEIREVDFWWYRSSYSFQAEAHFGQCKVADVDPHPRSNGHPHWGNVFLYLCDQGSQAGGGYAVLWTYNWMDYNQRPEDKLSHGMVRGDKDPQFSAVRYFEWSACEHKWDEVGPVERRSRGWHVYKCAHCGAGHTVDSGD